MEHKREPKWTPLDWGSLAVGLIVLIIVLVLL